MANIISCIRIVLSVALLFCPALSPAFYALYMAAGFSDMIDGAVARKTGSVSELGSRLDTIADIVFTVVSLIKLLPVLDAPGWLYPWISVIAIIKLLNIAIGAIRQKAFVAVHSEMNKVTGCLLFIFPLTLAFIDLKYSAAVVCAAATAAAFYEGYLIQAGRTTWRHILACQHHLSYKMSRLWHSLPQRNWPETPGSSATRRTPRSRGSDGKHKKSSGL